MNTSLASSKWQPAASLQQVQQRATLLRTIREYFFSVGVTEVVTPVLSRYATTDPQIESFVAATGAATDPSSLTRATSGEGRRYLHTSPEFPMKRLLCAGSGDIYQVCSVFRREEGGRLHNPEFQLLEWYRCGFDHQQLMQDVEDFVRGCWHALTQRPCPEFTSISYYGAVHSATGIDSHSLSPQSLQDFFQKNEIDCPLKVSGPEADSLDIWLDFLMSMVVAPGFNNLPGGPGFVFLYDYPASQAALARLLPESSGTLAARFELFYGSTELANGFHELADADEQRKRFEHDLLVRREAGLESVPMDEDLLKALASGLPDCAGVAIGLDRLLMTLTGADCIEDVMAFPDDRA